MNDEGQIRRFFEQLGALQSGERAALKRACGSSLNETDSCSFAAFYKVLPFGVPKWQEDRWFCVACLSCLWPAEEQSVMAFEDCLSKLKEDVSDSFEKRIISLLDYEWNDDNRLALKLLRIMKILKQKNYKPDMAKLLKDLCRWNQPDRSVQKKWARAFYHAPDINEKEKKENVD
jgi:CRISPR type I-E-associated protein CasB/Cse2